MQSDRTNHAPAGRRFAPTEEQQAAIEAYAADKSMVLNAGAGTGKTSTLRLLGEARRDRRAIYIAFNRAIANDARGSFPRNVECRTAHSLAFRTIGRQYAHRLNGPRQPARIAAQLLGAEPLRVDQSLMLAPAQVARIAIDTITRFCQSADTEVGSAHVPYVRGIDYPAAKHAVRTAAVPLARKAWADLSRLDGRLKFAHDHYLKLWALTEPVLDADVVMLDEAQDSNPLVASIFDRQSHAQRIAVGDACQAIYGWRGAVDAMSGFDADVRLLLSQSFRFGSAVAAEANKWLQVLAAELRLRGYDKIPSRLAALPEPDAILCRSNAGAITYLIDAAEQGRRAALVGGGDEIRRLAEAAIELRAGRGTAHPELMAFMTWGQVQQYVEEESAGSDLKVLVRLIDSHGPETIIALVNRLVDERDADVVVSTAHKAKGREWPRVLVADDFREPKRKDDEPPSAALIPRDDAMLAYVTVTRAREVLDRGGLAWIDGWCSGPAPAPADLFQATGDEQDTKRCPKCGTVKPLEDFYLRRNGRPSSYCRLCTRDANKASYARRRRDPATLEQMRAVDRTRKRRYRALRASGPGGEAA